MSWISGLIGGVAAGAGVRGYNQSANTHNKFWQPGTINNYAKGLNPWVWNAIMGKQGGGNGFNQDLYNIAQGKDISPYLLNQPLNQVNRGADTNMARMQATLGRSNMSGGLANGYALSNQMGRQNAIANLYQNYGQFREQQRRSDLDWLLGQITNSQQRGTELAGQHRFKKNFWEKLGAFGTGFASASGGGDLFGSKKQEDKGGPLYPNYQQPQDYNYGMNFGNGPGSWYQGSNVGNGSNNNSWWG